MRIGERVLLALSRSPASDDYEDAVDLETVATALDSLRTHFPDLDALVRGRRVLDFGCGSGAQAAALVRAGAAEVVGVDINESTLEHARRRAEENGIGPDRLRFVTRLPPELAGTFDAVISQDAMEHFADPEATLREMRAVLRPGGCVLLSFGPPWLAPSGSHMHFFTRVPWVNLFFSERTVMAVRSRFRFDGAKRYEEVESGLNRMTVRRFEGIVARSGLRAERLRYRCVRGLDALAALPLARELFINNVSCVLARPSAAP